MSISLGLTESRVIGGSEAKLLIPSLAENPAGKYVIPSLTVAGALVGIIALVVAKDGTDPTWRLVRCFAGFFSAMLWIAAIADEVVEILQVT